MFLAKLADILPRGVREKLFFLGVGKALRKAGVQENDVGKYLSLLTGWKSKASGFVLIGSGIAAIGHSLSGTFSFDELTKGFGLIGSGLAILGIGGKAEKLTEATLIAGGKLEAGDAATMKANQ